MVFAGACSYGILSTFVKLAHGDGYTIEEIALFQAIIGMVVLWAIVLLSGKAELKQLSSVKVSGWISLLLTGSTIGLTSLLYYYSVKYIPASFAIVLLMQFTWMGLLLEWLIFKIKATTSQVIIALIILMATIMASGIVKTTSMHVSVPGICYALGAAFLYALYIMANSRLKSGIRPVTKSAVMMLGSVSAIITLTLHNLIEIHHFDLHLMMWAGFLALFGTIIPPVLFAFGIPKIGSATSSLLMTAELPVAILCSHFILKEQLEPVQWLGVVIMLFAMIWIKRKKKDSRKII